MDSPRVIAIVGPTAVGKSDLAVRLAQQLGDCEIVNADSMQLYRGLDIGTGKLTMDERGGIPHHLLDLWEISERASVRGYQELARHEIDKVIAAGKRALVVGGSGLYVSAVLDDLAFPATDPVVRARWEAALDARGPHELHAELAVLDPAAALAIQPANGRKIVRALEVIELTGQPFTATLGNQQHHYDATVIGLDLDREVLNARIDARVDAMWEQGWVVETVGLFAAGLGIAPTASRALGYQQIMRFIAGETSEDEAREDTKTATRRFARKQLSWFRRDNRTIWLDAARPDLDEHVRSLLA